MNVICLIGRLTRDPELRYTPSNIAVCKFTLAVDRKFKSDGQPTADFINCVAWRSTAEFISKYFDKGVRMGVTGSLQINTWENEEGKKMYSAEVLVNSIDFADGKKDVSTSAQPKVKVNKSEDEPQFIVLDDGDWDDIPF